MDSSQIFLIFFYCSLFIYYHYIYLTFIIKLAKLIKLRVLILLERLQHLSLFLSDKVWLHDTELFLSPFSHQHLLLINLNRIQIKERKVL